MTTLVVLAVFALSGLVIWLAFAEVGAIHGEPPLIRASTGPLKKAPDDPGGRVVADLGGVGELLADRPMDAPEERLMASPEQPLSPAEAALVSLGQEDAANGLAPDPAKRDEAALALKQMVDGLLADEGVGAGGPVSATTERLPSPPRPADRLAAKVPRSSAGAEIPNEPETRGNQGFSGDRTDIAALAAGASSSNRQSAPPAAEGGFRVQLAAVRGEEDAKRAWLLFRDELAEHIGHLTPYFEIASTDNGSFYRVQVGPFTDDDEAQSLCVELKKQNKSCFVVTR
jgi:cell division septation protein DedD